MSSDAASHGDNKHFAFSATLVVIAVATFFISPFISVAVTAVAALHAHLARLSTTRNILLVLLVVAVVLAVMSGAGGDTESDSFGI